jgi:hypothetical protein
MTDKENDFDKLMKQFDESMKKFFECARRGRGLLSEIQAETKLKLAKIEDQQD